MITRQDIYDALLKTPSAPFRILLTDGTTFVIGGFGDIVLFSKHALLTSRTKETGKKSGFPEEVPYEKMTRLEPVGSPAATV
jgi:hypothetical protein